MAQNARPGRSRSRKSKHPAEFYICPSCEKAFVYVVARDLYKRPVYKCGKCGEMFGEGVLEMHDRRRRALGLR